MLDDDFIVAHILQYEGGFTNDPLDHGGPTNFGITASDLGAFRGLDRPATAADVSGMSKDDAKAIYEKTYIKAPGFDRIKDGYLRLVVVDSGVLFGTVRATKWLQQAVGTVIDGQFGQRTEDALAPVDPKICAHKILSLRFLRVGDIVTHEVSQLRFLNGWLARTANLLTLGDTGV